MIDRRKLYDLIYNKADKLFKKYNPCEIGKNIFGEICCKKTDNAQLCCTGCNYLSKNGCTIRCLACKLCLCTGEGILRNKLSKLREIAHNYDLYHSRMSKKELFAAQKRQYPLFYWKDLIKV